MKFKNDIAIFLAARSGSKRLPNKHFFKLDKNYNVIEFCIKRLQRSKTVKKIFLCTTKKKEDDKFVHICKKHNIELFRGSEKNVLKRFIDCAKQNSIRTIVRITADCPLIDTDILDKCLKIHLKKNLDYTSNILELSFPDGLDVEIVNLEALIKSKNLRIKDLNNKEHVTSFIRKSKLFKKYNLKSSKNYSSRRWTLDNKDDLTYIKKIVCYFSPNIYFSWKKVLELEKTSNSLNIKKRSDQKNHFKKKIIIGSANFFQKYGINNRKVQHKEIKKILDLAKKNKIDIIDTATGYLSDDSILKNLNHRFKFNSKINPDSNWTSYEHCKKKLQNHVKKMNSNIEILLFHDTKILFKEEGKKIFENIKLLKKKGFFKKIGISIYNPNHLSYLTSKYDIEVVQCPYNIFDKRIIDSGWLKELKKNKIEVHARSIFLQGILFNKNYLKKKYFRKWKNHFDLWFEYLRKNKISEIDYCINDIINHDFDKIIIGIENFENFKQLLNFKPLQNINEMIDLTNNDLKLIDPRKWKTA